MTVWVDGFGKLEATPLYLEPGKEVCHFYSTYGQLVGGFSSCTMAESFP